MVHSNDFSMERWSRQIILPELGIAGQQRLLDAKVLCIGSGALGSPATLYLAAAGVGHLVIVDPDVVESSNLQRQILHGESFRGRLKIESAASRLLDLNPTLRLETHAVRFTPENALSLSEGCAVIVDGSDNFPTRFLTNDTAFFRKIPLVHAAIQKFEGQMTVFAPHRGGPCYRCLLPELPAPGAVPSCAEAGVIGALPGIMGSMQAMETIKLITGIGEPAIGHMTCYDALRNRFRQIALAPDPDCALCGKSPRLFHVSNPQTNAPTHCTMSTIPAISVNELHELLTTSPGIRLIDVREPDEYAAAAISGSELVPLATIPEASQDWPKEQRLYLHCKAGGRSARAAQFLMDQGFADVINVTGGMDAWLAAGLPKKE
ncbi:MAG: molybdopterin-synthase adenylyltransferase MoeB [Verrucomicrobiota bacterium]